MITRLSARRASTLAASSRPPLPPHDGALYSLGGPSSAGLFPPPPLSSPPTGSSLPPPLFASRPTPPHSLSESSSLPSTPPPISASQLPPITPRPPERTAQPLAAARPPPSIPSSLSFVPSSFIPSNPLPTPPPKPSTSGSWEATTWQPEVVPEVSTFEELLESARIQRGRWSQQARPKQKVPGMHDRRYKATVVTATGRQLGSSDFQELGVRLAIIGRLKREFGALEKVAFEQDPDLFVFPPFPSPVFNFTILHHHAIPPDHSFPDGRDGYRLRGVLPTSLSRPPVGGPSLANLLQAVAHHPSKTLRDIPSPTVATQQTVFPDPEEEPVVSGHEFFIEVTQDSNWNPSYVLDPHATFQTRYETHEWESQRCIPDLKMFELETLYWDHGLGKFDGFAGKLRDAQDAMVRRLGRNLGEVDDRPIEVRALPRAGDLATRGGDQVDGRGPFGQSAPVMAGPRLVRVGGLAGDKTAFAGIKTDADDSSPFAGPSTDAEAPPPEAWASAPHLALNPSASTPADATPVDAEVFLSVDSQGESTISKPADAPRLPSFLASDSRPSPSLNEPLLNLSLPSPVHSRQPTLNHKPIRPPVEDRLEADYQSRPSSFGLVDDGHVPAFEVHPPVEHVEPEQEYEFDPQDKPEEGDEPQKDDEPPSLASPGSAPPPASFLFAKPTKRTDRSVDEDLVSRPYTDEEKASQRK